MNEQRVIAVDLGGTNVRAAVVTESGRLTHREEAPTKAERGPDAVIELMSDLIRRTARGSGLSERTTVGVASPGPLNPRTGIVLFTPNLPGWSNVPLVDRLREQTNHPVFVANHGNCGALGEARFGSAKGVQDLVYLALGTGVGGGIISGGALVDGVRGLGAEVGHVGISMDGPRCSCGSIGCLEAFVSGWAIQRDAEAVATTADGRLLHDLARGGNVHAGVVAEGAKRGNAAAALILDRAGRALGTAMGAFANLFNPQMIVIGGGVAELGEFLLNPARQHLQAHSFVDMRADLSIAYSSLGGDTGLYGAAALALANRHEQEMAM